MRFKLTVVATQHTPLARSTLRIYESSATSPDAGTHLRTLSRSFSKLFSGCSQSYEASHRAEKNRRFTLVLVYTYRLSLTNDA